MQTFLPYLGFVKTAEILDYKRLGKQRVEAKQILEINLAFLNGTLERPVKYVGDEIYPVKVILSYPYENHPATLMWRGFENALAYYGKVICEEWIKRGYKDNLLPFFNSYAIDHVIIFPDWLGNPNLHLSHQSNLIRKNPEYYRPIFGENVPNNLPYYWPLKEEIK